VAPADDLAARQGRARPYRRVRTGSPIRRRLAPIAVLLALLAAASGSSRADVAPGDVIGTANADRVQELVSPGLLWCVRHGLPMHVVAPESVPIRRAFVAATEKYAAQVRLGADGLTLENYVAGRPFPKLDPSDAQVAVKIMQNYSMQSAIDDVDIRNFDADTGPISMKSPLQIERHFLIGHLRRLQYNGRLYVDPKPQIPNTEGFNYKETLHPVIEPFDLKGVGSTSYRYLDPARQDDTWLYLPSLRRVRRFSTTQRSDALFGQDTDIDSYAGYAGQIAWMDWRLLSDGPKLAAFHTTHFP
jgi:hypothetical protein